MSKNAICVLANDIKFFKLMICNLPEDFKDYALIVVNEDRIGDKTQTLQKILKMYNVKNYIILKATDIVNEFIKQNKLKTTKFINDYTMGMNILSLWFLIAKYNFNKILLTDDDVIFFEGLKNVFSLNKNAYVTYRLSAGLKYEKLGKTEKKVFEEWYKIFDLTLNKETHDAYIKNYLSSGQRLIVVKNINIKEYEKYLIKFFESKILFERWENRKVPTSGFLDERFETFFFLNKIEKDLLKDFVTIHCLGIEKTKDNDYYKFKNKTIFHNATKSHKKEIYKEMIKRGIIKGE